MDQNHIHHHVTKAICSVLQQDGMVVIPSFGGFILKSKSSFPSDKSSKFYAPSSEVLFSKRLVQNDFVLVQEIALRLNISNAKSNEALKNWVIKLVNDLKVNKKFLIDKLGVLSLNGKRVEFTKQLSNSIIIKDNFGLEPLRISKIDKGIQRKKRDNTALFKVAFLFLLVSNLILIGMYRDFNPKQISASVSNYFHENDQVNSITYHSRSNHSNQLELLEIADLAKHIINEIDTLSTLKPKINVAKKESLSEIESFNNKNAYLIKGCFKSKRNALKLSKKHRSNGLNAGVVLHKGLYKVYLNKDQSKDKIWNNLVKYQSSYGVDVWVLD